MQTLLGDPLTATIHRKAAKDVLKHRFPENADMTHTPSHGTVTETSPSPQVEYVWQQIARLAEETFEAKKQADKERADKEKEHQARERERLRADAEAQRAEALAAEAALAKAEAESAKAEVARLRARLGES
jgi:membrane protein involved in colicin uptake